MTALPPDRIYLQVYALESEVRRLRAELSALRAVPREPTLAMMQAVAAYVNSRKFDRDDDEEIFREIWRTMYDAAPQAHPGEEKSDDNERMGPFENADDLIKALEAGEESAAIPASDSTVPPGDGAAACNREA